MKPVPRFLQRNANSITRLLTTECLNVNCLGPATGTHSYGGTALVHSGISLSCQQALNGSYTSVTQEPHVFPALTGWCISQGRRSLPEESTALRRNKIGIRAAVSGPWRPSAARPAPPGPPPLPVPDLLRSPRQRRGGAGPGRGTARRSRCAAPLRGEEENKEGTGKGEKKGKKWEKRE